MARRTGAVLLVGTILGGWATPVLAQDVSAPARRAGRHAAGPAPRRSRPVTPGTIRSISVRGAQRLEPATVISYSNLRRARPTMPRRSIRR